MYPARDFRSVILDPGPESWRPMLREPLDELLKYWEKTGRPENLKELYSKGIQEGVSKTRWPIYQLNLIDTFPEFYASVYIGLEKVWSDLSFGIIQIDEEYSLTIDNGDGQPIKLTTEDTIHILRMMRSSLSITLEINGQPRTVGVFPSKKAREIYQKMFWLASALEYQKKL